MHFERNNFCAAAALLAAILISACAQRDNGGDEADVARLAPAPQGINSFVHGTPITTCNLETGNGKAWDGTDIEVRAGQELTVSGWLLAPEDAGTSADWWVVFQTETGAMFAMPFTSRSARGDLISLFPGRDVGSAGFELSARVPDVRAGRLSVFLAEVQGENRRVCGIGRGLSVKAN